MARWAGTKLVMEASVTTPLAQESEMLPEVMERAV